MDLSTLASLAQDLSDVEHAILLSLMAKQHCIIETDDIALGALAEEIEAVGLPLRPVSPSPGKKIGQGGKQRKTDG